jgi:hypothetical protein
VGIPNTCTYLTRRHKKHFRIANWRTDETLCKRKKEARLHACAD